MHGSVLQLQSVISRYFLYGQGGHFFLGETEGVTVIVELGVAVADMVADGDAEGVDVGSGLEVDEAVADSEGVADPEGVAVPEGVADPEGVPVAEGEDVSEGPGVGETEGELVIVRTIEGLAETEGVSLMIIFLHFSIPFFPFPTQ